MITRLLEQTELPLIWTIDRREFIERIYRLQDGQLVLEPRFFQVPGWAPGQQKTEGPAFAACFERGGAFHGVFNGEVLAAIAVVDPKPVGSAPDLVQLKFLHVGNGYRKQRLGGALFATAATTAREWGASGLYISATPSENTVDFYRHVGCRLITEPDRELFALEPEDIHLEWRAR